MNSRREPPSTAQTLWEHLKRWGARLRDRVPLMPQSRSTWTDWARQNAEAFALHQDEHGFAWRWVNEAVNALISGGLYREALSYAERWPESARRAARLAAPNDWALVEINLAEAEYNLGRIDAAFDRIEQLITVIESNTEPFGAAAHVEPIVVAGTHCQRAWIAGLRGEHALGLQYVAAIDEAALPQTFRAEVDYTRALSLLKAGRSQEAEAAAEAGLARCSRPSSERNGLFLIGIILAERGDHVMAERAFERGIEHPYNGQGGDGLLRCARMFAQLGREHEARRVLGFCIARDPQSAAAKEAQALLDPDPAKSHA